MEPVAVGVLGLGALVALIAIRVPVAYAMIVVGGVGIAVLNGPGIVLSQLKDLAYGQFSIYDLSVVPLFVLMGAIASRCGLSADLSGRRMRGWAGCAAASRFRPSPPAPDSAPYAAARWPRLRRWGASPCPN